MINRKATTEKVAPNPYSTTKMNARVCSLTTTEMIFSDGLAIVIVPKSSPKSRKLPLKIGEHFSDVQMVKKICSNVK